MLAGPWLSQEACGDNREAVEVSVRMSFTPGRLGNCGRPSAGIVLCNAAGRLCMLELSDSEDWPLLTRSR